jgi:RNA polymerase sigma-70 factor (sigma-E family)
VDESFELFVETRLAGLLRLASVLAGDRGTAEDVVQEVLFRASKQWSMIATRQSPDAYVRRMVVNEYLSWRRKWSRVVPMADLVDDRRVPDHAARHADHDDLARRLDQLPARQRSVLVLRYYEGLTDDTIAQILGCSTGTVRSHASRALAALRIEWQSESGQPTPSAISLSGKDT